MCVRFGEWTGPAELQIGSCDVTAAFSWSLDLHSTNFQIPTMADPASLKQQKMFGLFNLELVSVSHCRFCLKNLLIVVILSLTFSTPSHAFSKVGHQLVCELAYQTLSDINKDKVDNLLRLIPTDHQTLINRYSRQQKKAAVSFSNACLWADAIKNDKLLGIVYKKYK